MHADPSMVMPEAMMKDAAMDQQRMQPQGGNAQGVQNFNQLVNNINPNMLAMDPATLAMMKAQQPDGNMAASVMKGIKWVRKEVDGSLDSLESAVNELKDSSHKELNMADVLQLQLEASTFTFTMTMTTNIVHKGTQHLDTLIKAQ